MTAARRLRHDVDVEQFVTAFVDGAPRELHCKARVLATYGTVDELVMTDALTGASVPASKITARDLTAILICLMESAEELWGPS